VLVTLDGCLRVRIRQEKYKLKIASIFSLENVKKLNIARKKLDDFVH